ncbi:MAG TPA: hypothetical protein VIH99_07205 [Bdellovibrionota bacterium]|jgi:hypothetical protein
MELLQHRPRKKEWLWVVLAVLPFLSIYLIHVHCLGPASTGFIQADQAYYMANGRAIFTRGNGFTHPNPFDDSLSSPNIYIHWPIWVSGVLMRLLGIDPGVFFVALGIIASFFFSLFTWELTSLFTKDKKLRPACFLLVIWGGGLFTLAAAIGHLWQSASFDEIPRFNPMAFDPFGGFWFLNWGRNLIYSLETVYHVLLLGTWLAVLKREWKLALLFAVATIFAHPFTAVGLGCSLVLWIALTRLPPLREKIPAFFLLALLFALAAFGAYYGIFLPSFPEHALIMKQWSVPWNMTLTQNVLALAPALALAAWELFRDRGRKWLTREELFFLCCFISAFLLSNHQYFIHARQPLHFTRGYAWLPLVMIGLPVLEKIFSRLRNRGGIALMGAFLFLASLDNLGFLYENADSCAEHVRLAPEVRAIFREADKRGLRGSYYSPLPGAGILAPTYSNFIPYCSHSHLTPDAMSRIFAVKKSFELRKPGKWLESVEYLLLARGDGTGWLLSPAWEPVLTEGNYTLWHRKR